MVDEFKEFSVLRGDSSGVALIFSSGGGVLVACAGVRQDLSNTVCLPYHKASLWLKPAGVGGSVSQSGKQGLR